MREASEKHRESLEEDVKQRRAEEDALGGLAGSTEAGVPSVSYCLYRGWGMQVY